MSDLPGASMRIDRDTAIDMAVYSGNLLYQAADEAHAFALTLIVSNLFELIGEGETSADRFADGFAKVARLANMEATVLGWDSICIAKAIRNWIDHGLRLDRPQEMNSRTKARATIGRIDFIPVIEESVSDDIYRVYCSGEGSFELLFSPTRFWSSVQDWYEGRNK